MIGDYKSGLHVAEAVLFLHWTIVIFLMPQNIFTVPLPFMLGPEPNSNKFEVGESKIAPFRSEF